MKLQSTFLLLLLLTVVAFAGCYTQLGYHASSNFEHGHRYRSVRDIETEHTSKTESEETEHAHDTDAESEEAEHRHDTDTESEEVEREHEDAEKSEGYYGRRKRTSRTVYVYPDGYHTHWVPYTYAYPSFFYYPYHPFYGYRYYYYGYRAPYYRYYRGYYPYRNVYRRYHSGSRYTPHSRRTYKKGDLRLENRRSRSSRSVTSPRSRSERLRTRNQNKTR